MASKGKLVTAKEVLAAGVHPGPVMETAIITLAHLAFISEKVELEVLYLASITCVLVHAFCVASAWKSHFFTCLSQCHNNIYFHLCFIE